MADSLGFGCFGQPKVHIELGGDLDIKLALQGFPRCRQARQVKNRSLHERATGLLGRMLIQ